MRKKGHHTRLGEINLLILQPTYPQKKSLVRTVRALMTQNIMGSSDAQCNTKKSP